MKITKEIQEKFQEIQLAEQNLQNFLLQKQAFQIELNETESALEETNKASGEIYKIVGNIMIKAVKEDVLKEMQEKKVILNLRLKAIQNQEKILAEKLEKLKEDIENKLKTEKK